MKAKAIMNLVIAILIIVGFSASALAAPISPAKITTGASGRSDLPTGGLQETTYAGNVTGLDVVSTKITESWQGYYGNISGYITLDDALNNTLYNWSITSPSGQIYASNGSVTSWASVYCVNESTTKNISQIETWLNIGASDEDGVDETFNVTFAGSFTVGAVTINSADDCQQATTFKDEAYQATDFVEVILSAEQNYIWTAILENDVDGFKSTVDNNDFQMLVGEDGHSGDVSTTQYFFYTEVS